MQPQYTLHTATPDDLGEIQEILAQGKAALHGAGIPQWQNGYPADELVLADITSGGCHLLQAGNRLLGTAALLHGEDPTYTTIYEGEWLTSGTPYAALHRIAVADTAKGTGAAAAFYALLEQQAKAGGAASIRVDTHRLNKRMQAFLQKCGFVYCGIIYIEDGAERVAFEKKL